MEMEILVRKGDLGESADLERGRSLLHCSIMMLWERAQLPV